MVKVLLVVDDSRTIRAAVELIFEGTEYRVVAKDTGAAGLAWVRSHTPDLILVDERMQDMDGYAFGAQIKASSKNEDVPILLLACQDGPDESRADDADLDGYVNKPFGSQELVTLVEMLTGSSQISQMPLSFKEQLAQRTREKKERALHGDGHAPASEGLDEQSSFEAELASAAEDEPKPAKADEPVVEIPTIDTEPQEDLPPVRLETKTIPLPPPPASAISSDVPGEEEERRTYAHDDFEVSDAGEDEEDEPIAAPVRAPEPEPVTPPLAPRVEPPPPPRFPPPPAAPPPLDFAIQLPPSQHREPSAPRRPPASTISSPPVLPPLRASYQDWVEPARSTPPPLPPMPQTPDLVNIEAPVDASPQIEEPVEAPLPMSEVYDPTDREEASLPVVQTFPIEPTPPPPSEPAPVAPPSLPVMPPPQATISTTDVQMQSGSRGLLFALLALAVIGGLIAFFFVSK